jgi:flagellar M-ring protein FliF
VQDFYRSLGTAARFGLVAGVLLLLLFTVVALWWAMTPRYQLLFGNLREADAAEIAESLTEWKVPYDYSEDGSGIRVPAERVYDTRMKLVSAGVPSGGHVGFELFNDSDFGATEFAQRVNYQRALQGEIERTIAALPGVEMARVHLTIRRPGLFLGEQEASKASVALTLTPGTQLDARQVGGIRNLVASAVDGLSPESVVVLGPSGALLAGAGGDDTAVAQGERQLSYEGRIKERIEALISSAFGVESATVTVDARLNFDAVRQVNERLVAHGGNGHGLLVRKQTTRPVAGADGSTGGSAQEQVEYAHGTQREEIARAPGRVERLSIAVLLPTALPKAEMDRLYKLIAAAAGLDAERGDTLEIAAIGEMADTVPAADLAGTDLLAPPPPRPVDPAPAPAGEAQAVLPALHWLLAGGAGLLLLGVLLGWWMHPRPRRLTAKETEAMAGRMRTWLADGSVQA